MPLQATSGAASYDAFGGGVAAVPNYIEDVFSTYLYTGNGTTQTITNGIDLSTKGGLVWSKSRSNIENNVLLDTVRGPNNILVSNSTAAGSTSGTPYVTATTTGYSIGTSNNQINGSGLTYASWTFRKQPKFFDVVTWTGNNVNGRVIPHSLDAEVGFIAVKAITTSANDNNWVCRHRSQTSPDRLYLNTTAAASGSTNLAPTTTGFTVYANGYNETGVQYVAYLFAHNAGGFGLTGTDNVISCGSFTATGSDLNVNLGYEAQFVLIKNTAAAEDWYVLDTYRGMSLTTWGSKLLRPNTSGAESTTSSNWIFPSATGFTVGSSATSGNSYIYIAIRKGPMKVPTDATKVFTPVTYTGDGTTNRVITTGIVTDLFLGGNRSSGGVGWTQDRLRGQASLQTYQTNAEQVDPTINPKFDVMTGVNLFNANGSAFNASGSTYVRYGFQRAPSFFDEVCYTGTGSAKTVTHNLGAVPELMIVKERSAVNGWPVYASTITNAATGFLLLNSTDAFASPTAQYWNNTAPTSSVFTVGTNSAVNASTQTFVAYLFATCAGVSKVGSYTGTGTTLQVDCGFAAGARFVLIKRTDSTGQWYVWDSVRGIVAGNDPYLLLNSTAAEVTSTDYIDTYSAGFEISSTAPAAINASGGTFIFLAIA